jgi:hypothetical protein
MNAPSDITQQKLLIILQRCLVELRNLAIGEHCPQIHDLADTVEIIPALMMRWEDRHIHVISDALTVYQAKYPGSYDYLSMLNMNEAAFQDAYQTREDDWTQCDPNCQRISALAPPS